MVYFLLTLQKAHRFPGLQVSKVALQIQPITQQRKGLEKRARKYMKMKINSSNKKKHTRKNKTSFYNVQ